MHKITCFGEVLWDVFPTHKKVGGAPLNVALRLHSFKNDVSIISSIGNDKKGRELKHYIEKQGLSTVYIQRSNTYETSEVAIALDEKGAATYTIKQPCAWDYILLEEHLLTLVKSSDAFIFGSLISRNKQSEDTLKTLLNEAVFSIFDVNLRPPHYQIEKLDTLMKSASFLKFNDDELFEINEKLGYVNNSIKENIKHISKFTNTDQICVTRGSNGALLFYNQKFYENPGYKVTIADTVGSGDSFLATLIDCLLNKKNPQKAIDNACAVGALVAQNQGANPKISTKQINNLITRSL
jgi:fructokinase